jgi:hypothetical protein
MDSNCLNKYLTTLCDLSSKRDLISSFTACSVGWWLVLVCSERRVLLAGCWWLICCERKVLLAGG